jgi:hypothetical protein
MKKILFFITAITILLLIYFKSIPIDIPKAKNILTEFLPKEVLIFYKSISNNLVIKNYEYAYNIFYAPKTQFVDLKIVKKKLNFVTKGWFYPFYFDFYNSQIIIVDSKGKIILNQIKEIINDEKLNENLISNNINENETVMDILVINEKLFMSYYKLDNSENESCYKFGIKVGKISKKFIKFDDFFSSNECGDTIQGGRMQYFNFKGSDGFLITVSDNKLDYPNMSAQSDTSIFGKILFFDFHSDKYTVYSKGHRNAQGLYTDKNVILSTEHGPRGGDEINKIIFGENYGWPIASYGEKYEINKKSQQYKKNHSQNNFKEPIYAFIPSIGINEIIKIENSFSDKWQNNFLISSLNGRSLFRLQFDSKYEKLIYSEKIFIGERIRDLKFDKINNVIFLALTETGELAILINEND